MGVIQGDARSLDYSSDAFKTFCLKRKGVCNEYFE